MARIVTSDGIQVNLFLDLDSENTGSGLLLYGPKTQPKMDFIVQGFEDFKINEEYNDEHELVLHTGDDESSVNILSLMADNPTSSNPYVVDSNTNLYFVGNDLILSRDGEKIHRIDLLKGDVTNIDDIKSDISSNDADIENLKNEIDAIKAGGGGGSAALYSPPQTLFLDRDLHDSIQTIATRLYTYDGGGTATVKHTVAEFENFKTTHDDKYKLTFYSGTGYSEVIISDLINISPTSANPLMFQYDNDGDDAEWKLYFDGNHLVLKMQRGGEVSGNHRYAVYRIDMHLNAFGGGVTKLNNKTGDLQIQAGTNVSIDTVGSNITINSIGGGDQTVQPNWSTGWVNTDNSTSVANGATLSFTHNLNSTDVIYHIYAADDANGTNAVSLDYQNDAMNALTDQWGAQITDISNNSFKLRLAYGYFIKINDHDLSSTQAVNFTGQYIKVVASSAATSVVDAYTKSETYTKTEIDELLLNVGGCYDDGILYLKYWFAGDPSTNADVTDKINLTYPPADFPAGKRLLLTTDVSTGSVGDTQYRTDAYLYTRNDSLEQWDYIDKIDSNFNWELIKPQVTDCKGHSSSAATSVVDTYTKTEIDQLLINNSSSAGGEFPNHVRFFSSNPSWTKPDGVNFILAIVQSGGNSNGSDSTITIPNTSFHKKITSIISMSSGVEYTEFSDIIGKSFTFQYLKEDLNLIQNWVFTETLSGVNNSGVTLTPSSVTGNKHGFVGYQSPLNSTWIGGHSMTYGRDGVWLGGGEGSIGSPGRYPGKGGTLNGLSTLGGANPGEFGGAGGFAGGGAGYTSDSSYITDYNREGGSGFGAGGGGGQHNSGEYDVYFIIVPSTQSSWNIVVGAGGTAANHMSGGGSGGQGAVFLYY